MTPMWQMSPRKAAIPRAAGKFHFPGNLTASTYRKQGSLGKIVVAVTEKRDGNSCEFTGKYGGALIQP